MQQQIPAPPWHTSRRKPVKPQLTQDLIVDTAIKLLDEEGLAAVTMRRVAEELNTGPASLYAHVGSKDELLDLVYEKIIAEIPVPVADPERWADQLRQMCRDSYRVLSAHHDAASISMANLPTGVNALKLGEAMLSLLLAGGVPPQQAAWAVDRISLYISADAYEGSLYTLRWKGSGKSLEEWTAGYFGGMKEYYQTLPPAMFPSFLSNLDVMMTGDGDERFEFGLEMMVRSLELMAAEHKRKSGKRGGV